MGNYKAEHSVDVQKDVYNTVSRSWEEIYKSKLVSAEEAITCIKDGDTVVTGFACGEPFGIERALIENYKSFHDVKIVNMLSLGSSPWCRPEMEGHFTLNCLFASNSNRMHIASGVADFTPINFSEIPEVIRDFIRPRVSVCMVSPPDSHGNVSFGTTVDYTKGTTDYTEVVIAQVNKHVPRTLGDSTKNVRDFTYFVEIDEPLPEVKSVEITDIERKIGKNCSSLINNGDCLQLGIGGIPDAICEELGDKKDLGLHSELVGDGVVKLLESGVINNKRKQLHKGKTVLGAAFGSKILFDYINDNPAVEMHPIDYVNDPYVIAMNDNVVSINSCLQIDLLGQVVADTIGLSQVSAVGGQVDFIRGAAHSKNGRSIIAMTSTTKNDTVSKIVPKITKYSAITTTRNDVHCVVTEYGIAYLKGRTLKERARELIKIAHPKFRPMLEAEFENRFHEKAFD